MRPGAALVTGAGARLGRAMAQALGQDGWQVIIHYNTSKSGAEETEAAIRKAGGSAMILQADLLDEEAAGGLVLHAAQKTGQPVTLLVNSASVFEEDTLASHTRADWDAHMDANLRAPVLLAQAFADALPKGEKGLIVNMIDQRVWKPTPKFFTYSLSKAALWQATRTMAQALAPDIRVNGIGPGPTLQSKHQSEAEFAAEKAATLTREGSGPDEIVKALRYLISASSVTGQMIASDGGQHLMWQTPDTQL